MKKARAKQNMVPLKELNLTNRFLFDEVMEDAQTQQEVLSIVFGKEIPLLNHNESEKEIRLSPLIRSIRMDIFSTDEEDTVYATEMQDYRKKDIPKRSRYYQALMDTSLLEPGVPNYNLLNNTYLIMFMTFDLFGYKKYRYTFVPRCVEVPECELKDGAVRIFLNTKGKNDNEIPSELIELLHYLEDTTDIRAQKAESDRIRRIHERVRKVKASEEVGVKYMQAWEERYYDKQEAREEGLAEGRAEGRIEGRIEGRASMMKELIEKKLQKGKSVEEIADSLEESVDTIQALINKMNAEGIEK